ncbi:MAG: hypothetical protein HZB24_03560 [Desulfobacterales bacterium]|nr:hypothetical protein [Desulfobacterales bacterium]
MKPVDCLFERTANLGVGVSLMGMALGLIVIGLTVLPVLGILLSIPVFFVSAAFFFAPRSQECSIRS